MLDAFVAACGRLRAAAQAARDSILDSSASGSSGRVEPCWGSSQEATATRLRASLLLLKSNAYALVPIDSATRAAGDSFTLKVEGAAGPVYRDETWCDNNIDTVIG